MKKLLFIILLITSLFSLSCNHNKVLSPSYIGKVGEIEVDPYKVAPLSAVYRIEAVNGVPITVTVKGLYGEPDIVHTYPAGYGTEFEIHGMFPESDNIIEVNDGGRVISKNVRVETLSYNGTTIQKKYDVAINNLPEEKYPNNPEFYILEDTVTLGISRNGYVRYCIKYYGTKMVIENNKFVLYSHNNINNITLAGKVVSKKSTTSHHDIIKVNNNYIYLSHSTWGDQDTLIESDGNGRTIKTRKIGDLIKDIVLKNNDPQEIETLNKIVFDENNIYNNGKQQKIDWFHANSLVYDSSTDIMYISGRSRGVLAVDYSEWKLIWWMADETLNTRINQNYNGSGHIPYNVHFKDLPSLDPYRVKGAGKDDGPKNQHALFLHKNGNLGMFDNQGDEYSNPNGSRYVEYKIAGTHGNYTAQNVYEYRDSSLYSKTRSDVDFTGENYQNLLLVYSEKNPNVEVVEIEKNTKKELFKLITAPYMSYRVDKMPLYYDEGRVYSEDCNLKNSN